VLTQVLRRLSRSNTLEADQLRPTLLAANDLHPPRRNPDRLRDQPPQRRICPILHRWRGDLDRQRPAPGPDDPLARGARRQPHRHLGRSVAFGDVGRKGDQSTLTLGGVPFRFTPRPPQLSVWE
jgi:hypothetical protein